MPVSATVVTPPAPATVVAPDVVPEQPAVAPDVVVTVVTPAPATVVTPPAPGAPVVVAKAAGPASAAVPEQVHPPAAGPLGDAFSQAFGDWSDVDVDVTSQSEPWSVEDSDIEEALSEPDAAYAYGFDIVAGGGRECWRQVMLADGTALGDKEAATHTTTPADCAVHVGHFLDGTSAPIPGMTVLAADARFPKAVPKAAKSAPTSEATAAKAAKKILKRPAASPTAPAKKKNKVEVEDDAQKTDEVPDEDEEEESEEEESEEESDEDNEESSESEADVEDDPDGAQDDS